MERLLSAWLGAVLGWLATDEYIGTVLGGGVALASDEDEDEVIGEAMASNCIPTRCIREWCS